jgi:hypothetical protein
MSLYQQIIQALPELEDSILFSKDIILQDDSDGLGAYIAKWDYNQPIPDGLKLGK